MSKLTKKQTKIVDSTNQSFTDTDVSFMDSSFSEDLDLNSELTKFLNKYGFLAINHALQVGLANFTFKKTDDELIKVNNLMNTVHMAYLTFLNFQYKESHVYFDSEDCKEMCRYSDDLGKIAANWIRFMQPSQEDRQIMEILIELSNVLASCLPPFNYSSN